MTYKEKMMQEHPIYVSGEYLGGVKACPGTFFNGAPLACGRESKDRCTSCWNTKIPEQKKTEPKKAETPIDLIAKALESNDKSVHIRVEPDGITSVDIVPVDAFKETEEEPASELGQLNEQEAKEAIRFLQSKFKLGPYQNVVKHGCWRKINYHTDGYPGHEIDALGTVNVYCPEDGGVYAAFWSMVSRSWIIAGTVHANNNTELPFKPTHWMPLPEAPKNN